MSTCRRSLNSATRALRLSLNRCAPPAAQQPGRRPYAVASSAAPRFQVFNRRTKWLQKERAGANVQAGRQADYLKDEVAMRVAERLLDINRHFPKVLDLGANSCNIARALAADNPDPYPAKPESAPLSTRITELTAVESSETLLYRDSGLDFNKKLNITRRVLEDEETLPFEPESFDLVLSSLSMHWINDLPGILSQINSVLKPDSPFIGAMLGGDSLFELRTSLQLADLERRLQDADGGRRRHHRRLPRYDLQAMGESNATLGREMGPIGRDVLLANDAIYRELHGNEDGSVPATFRIIYMIGWREGENQPQPLPRGSGQTNLKELLEHK
ncbi:hypothetical protein LLEC1_03933 [Akanthomyces lecanii]|uniref:Methyltransferase type 11 domain-containing protein n=1 Tax=Cordyceps confragosa TaxID=2714763 RepID=A0A179I9N2_CORDF|nr:hypothetical protein LLEC1_03933 [Akanthomyces lecanii]